MRPSPSAESKFVWQKLEHFANCYAEGELETGNLHMGMLETGSSGDDASHDQDEYIVEDERDSDDFLFDLVCRNHLAMSEFTKFRLVMQHLEGDVSKFFLGRFAPLINFALFKDTERGFAISRLYIPEAAIYNALKYYSRITYMHTRFLNKFVANDRVPWQLFWRGERSTDTTHFSRMLIHALRRNTDVLLLLQLPDAVVVMLRFSHDNFKSSEKSALFTDEDQCSEQDLAGFMDVNSVFLSDHFGYVEEYTLKDDEYKIDISQQSLQLYRGEKRATFVHLRLAQRDASQPQISVDLTRFNRRILNGRRRHPLVRKSAVFDVECFVSNRSSLHATQPSKIKHLDILLEDGEHWESMQSHEVMRENDWEKELQLYEEATSEILNTMKDGFLGRADEAPDKKEFMLSFIEKVVRPIHRTYGASDKVPCSLKDHVESLTLELLRETSSLFNTHEKLTAILDLVPLLSDLGIDVPADLLSHNANEEDQEELAKIFLRTVSRWDLWLSLGPKRNAVFERLQAFMIQATNLMPEEGRPSFRMSFLQFVLKNVNEQAKILFHELRRGSEEVRASSSISRLVNLRVDPKPQSALAETQARKTPVVTLYGIQAIPAGLRFATGEYVCLVKQHSGVQETTNNKNLMKNYNTEFPTLGTTDQSDDEQKVDCYVEKHPGYCIGRVVSVVDAPFSIKVKLISPSYCTGPTTPLLIQKCLQHEADIYWELHMIPANVVAHERIMDSMALALEPKEDSNLFFSQQVCNFLISDDNNLFASDLNLQAMDETRTNTTLGEKALNPQQQDAVKTSITSTLSLVHGPPGNHSTTLALQIVTPSISQPTLALHCFPGTGKSTTIIGIIEEILAAGSGDKIMVCAETNLAVDNLALRLMKTCDKIVRVGSGEKVDPQLKSVHLESMVKGRVWDKSGHVGGKEQDFFLSKHKKIISEIISSAQVVFATVIGSADPILNGHKFSSVVVDEASMSTEPSMLCPLSHGCNRLILVGDHKQLGPHACDSSCMSLFERLISKAESGMILAPTTMLSQQHRMHSKLCDFPSQAFYDGRLVTAEGLDTKRLIPHAIFGGKLPIKFIAVENGREQRMKSGSWYNEVEVERVLTIVKKLVDEGARHDISTRSITVLTPYRAQQTRITLQLKNSWSGADQPPEVCSIDGYQGRENEIIVFSSVRCGSSLGFCDDERRINVLLTRAKRGLIVLGDRATLAKSSIWSKWIGQAESSN
ncbi:hypothetical protein ACHAWF_018847 [Thalassiosira exigua]